MYDGLSKLISLSESDQTLYYAMNQRQRAFLHNVWVYDLYGIA
jgi:hypothetical protein